MSFESLKLGGGEVGRERPLGTVRRVLHDDTCGRKPVSDSISPLEITLALCVLALKQKAIDQQYDLSILPAVRGDTAH